jgi:hypothetical protein
MEYPAAYARKILVHLIVDGARRRQELGMTKDRSFANREDGATARLLDRVDDQIQPTGNERSSPDVQPIWE